MSAELDAKRTAATAVLADFNRELHSAPLSKPPGREWIFRLADALGMLLDALGTAAESPRELDVAAVLTQADDTSPTVLTPLEAKHTVTFDLMADDDTYFVLTGALTDFASRQRWEAEDPTGNVESRVRWAECAEAALDHIEKSLCGPDDDTDATGGRL
jgi:hypothetical protein